jgi:hypothetical protein
MIFSPQDFPIKKILSLTAAVTLIALVAADAYDNVVESGDGNTTFAKY